jgi:ASC-1-like (ASCH) protein
MICHEPWFSFIASGKKSIEGRCGAKYNSVAAGDTIFFDCGPRTISRKVERVTRYANFEEMLLHENLSDVLPEISTTVQAIEIYRALYPLQKQLHEGVIALQLSRA